MSTKSKVIATTEPDATKGFAGVMTPRLLLEQFWERCADSLTDDELASVAGGVENAANDLGLLAASMSSVAGLLSCDHQKVGVGIRSGTLDDASQFLWSVASQIETLTAMVEIGDAASHRLIYRTR